MITFLKLEYPSRKRNIKFFDILLEATIVPGGVFSPTFLRMAGVLGALSLGLDELSLGLGALSLGLGALPLGLDELSLGLGALS
jgi:hypothetical protein